MQLNRVEQKHSSGCGLACLSMVSSGKLTYEQAMELVYPIDEFDHSDDDWYTDNGQLKDALDEMEVSHYGRFRTISKGWSDLGQKVDGLAIVACGLRGDKNWHWVVFDGSSGLVYDPDKNHTRPYLPNGRHRKPFRYLSIHD